MTPGFRTALHTCLAAVLAASLAAPAFADPPPWAPAHGYRAKHGHGHAATAYVAPFGIDLGRCDRAALGAALGGVAGGVIGANVGKGDGRTAAIIGGTIIGAIVGGSIGHSMDELDQNCVGQVLEHAPTGQPVAWQDPDMGAQYQVVPQRTYPAGNGRYCREYQATATVGGRQQQTYGTACRQPDGTWQLVN